MWLWAFKSALSSANRPSARFSTAAERSSLRFSAEAMYRQSSVKLRVPMLESAGPTPMIVQISAVKGLSRVRGSRGAASVGRDDPVGFAHLLPHDTTWFRCRTLRTSRLLLGSLP